MNPLTGCRILAQLEICWRYHVSYDGDGCGLLRALKHLLNGVNPGVCRLVHTNPDIPFTGRLHEPNPLLNLAPFLSAGKNSHDTRMAHSLLPQDFVSSPSICACRTILGWFSSCCPSRRKNLRLLQHRLHSDVLQIRWIAVLAENALDQNPHARSRRLSVLPIHGSVALQAAQ